MPDFLSKNKMEVILEEDASVVICHECGDISLHFNISPELWPQMRKLVQNQVFASYGELFKEGIKCILGDSREVKQ